ncbi:DsbA family protein [Anaerobacillus isosaccharinicus]|uniref:Dihydroneopterin aldolase n=1 Tax=Anaerobacillus isosaccharinicus TaxID=1532552 RepID=A0A1S2LK25_9BACI|nr:DsbA family protein [Anaerobacillus isosaccharinicus]MBA5584731.1 DsbA family protein [Anaerobacillus isosaccharinicus]QOY36900.1 DsbA family protein [Anaerobacillus isosaccharinicus]
MSKTNSNPMKPLILVTIAVVILVSVIVVLNSKQNTESNDVVFANHVPIDNQPTLGNLNAPVSVVEFGDYKCPACKEWSEHIFPQLKKDFIDSGKITFSYINVLFHGEESYLGSLAGESVWNQDPDAFWDFNKALYSEQPTRQNHDDYWITVDKVIDVAQKAVPQINLDQLERDILELTYKDDVLLDHQLVEEFNVQFTPSIMINGTMLEDPFDYDYIKLLIERGLGQ